MNNLAFNLHATGQLAEAEDLYRRAWNGRRRVLGEAHADTINPAWSLMTLYDNSKRYDEAERVLAELCRPELLGALPAAQQALLVARRGVVLARLGLDADAEPLLRDADRRLRETGQLRSISIRMVARTLASLYERTNRPDEAERWRADLARLEAATRPATQPATAPAPTTRSVWLIRDLDISV
jgi:tetratricopeptide (TPR) repeat protein